MEITIQSPVDMHLHVREKDILTNVMQHTASTFSGAVIMPNLISPVDSKEKLFSYRNDIQKACYGHTFEPYMTLFFRPYTKNELIEAAPHIIGVKLYPAGITTQSDNGVSDFDSVSETISFMQELDIPLLVHGESNGFVLDREKEFLTIYHELATNFPDLPIVMEHITTAESIEFLHQHKNVSATVTLHHLMITLDDVIGDLLEPHLFCKPIAKTPRDRDALREAVFEGHDQIMFGSDSAPHPTHKKECCGCAAGIFSAPVALQMLVQLFEHADQLDRLEDFVSLNARKRYKFTPLEKKVTLTNKPFKVPELYGNIRPFQHGKTIDWSISEITSQ